jgi:8-oxo-dGTP pyrophosphatase MutT (NUDIX family)
MLPKKQIGTAVILFNEKEELLVVKPNYKEGWLVPGGATDDNESPLHCAIRETEEEIGLIPTNLKLVGVYYGAKNGVFCDLLKFIFFGGVLSVDQVMGINLQTEELDQYAFVSVEKALPLLSSSLQKSLPACFDAIKNNNVAYIES